MFLKLRIYLICMILGVIGTASVYAESIECPSIGYDLVESTDGWPAGKIFVDDRISVKYGNQHCYYKKKIKIKFSWHQSYEFPDRVREACSWKRIKPSTPKTTVSTNKKYRTITINSSTHLAYITFELSRKEFSEKRRSFWIALGNQLIGESISRGLSCEEFQKETDSNSYDPYKGISGWEDVNQKQSNNPKKVTPPEKEIPKEEYDQKISNIINKIKTQSK